MSPLTKLLLLIAVIYAAWRWGRSGSRAAGRSGRSERTGRGREPVGVETMVRCQECGSFVLPSAGGCARSECPLPPPRAGQD